MIILRGWKSVWLKAIGNLTSSCIFFTNSCSLIKYSSVSSFRKFSNFSLHRSFLVLGGIPFIIWSVISNVFGVLLYLQGSPLRSYSSTESGSIWWKWYILMCQLLRHLGFDKVMEGHDPSRLILIYYPLLKEPRRSGKQPAAWATCMVRNSFDLFPEASPSLQTHTL